MEHPFDTLQFYVKAATGLLLLLNLALLLSIRFGMRSAKQLAAQLPESEAPAVLRTANRTLGLLIFTVIAMNAAAVFTNYQLRQAANAVAGSTGSVVWAQPDAR